VLAATNPVISSADNAREAAEKLRDGSQAAAKKVEDYPLGALLVAIGVGFALAMLMAGPSRRPPQRGGAIIGTGSLLTLATIDRMYKQVR
jgi:hypothetical protein